MNRLAILSPFFRGRRGGAAARLGFILPVLAAAVCMSVVPGSHAFSVNASCFGFALQDTVSADTVITVRQQAIWTAEELKEVLQRQSIDGSGRKVTWREVKNPRVAMFCSLIVPGLGQFYNERPLKAALALGFEAYYLNLVMMNYRYAKRAERRRDRYEEKSLDWYNQNLWVEEYKERVVDWIWWSAGALAVIILDAYIDAHLHDMRVNVEQRPEGGEVGLSVSIPF